MARGKSERPRPSDSISPSLKRFSVAALSTAIFVLSARLADVLMDRAAEFPSLNDTTLDGMVGLNSEAKTLCEDGVLRTSAGFEVSRVEVENWSRVKRQTFFDDLELVDQSSHFCRGERPAEGDNQNRLTDDDTAFAADHFSFTWHLVNTEPVEGGFMRADFQANPYPAWFHVAPYTHSVIFLPGAGSIASTTDSPGVMPSVPDALK